MTNRQRLSRNENEDEDATLRKAKVFVSRLCLSAAMIISRVVNLHYAFRETMLTTLKSKSVVAAASFMEIEEDVNYDVSSHHSC